MRHIFKLFKMPWVWVVVYQFLKPFDFSKPNSILSFAKAYKTFFLLALVNFLSLSKKRCFFLHGCPFRLSRGQCEWTFRRDLMGLRTRRTSGFGVNIARSIPKKFAELSKWSGDVIRRSGMKIFNAVSHNRARPYFRIQHGRGEVRAHRVYLNVHYSQTKWSVPLKIALMNLLFEIWTR